MYLGHTVPSAPSIANMATTNSLTIAICGAGLTGLGLALALQSHGIRCTIYEAADTPERGLRGSLQLAPNGQTPLDKYGILDDLLRSSRIFEQGRLMKNDGTLIQELVLGDKELFGYDCMRIVRKILIRKLVDTVKARGVEIFCNKKFARIQSETKSEVTMEFADGTTASASLLVGADGIHSRLRQSLFPEVKTKFIGSVVVGGSFSASNLDGIEDLPWGLYVSPIGTSMIGPHTNDDAEWVVFVSKPYADLGKEGWKEMINNKDKLRDFLMEGRNVWLPQIQLAITNLEDDNLFLWPMYVLPELESWTSPKSRIVLVGDAAHAMPPTAGQGANMAFEDGYTLGLTLALVGEKVSLDAALVFWQNIRKDRIKEVLDLTMQWAKMREPMNGENTLSEYEAFKSASTHDARVEQMRWLFGGVDVQEQQIKDWVAKIENQ